MFAKYLEENPQATLHHLKHHFKVHESRIFAACKVHSNSRTAYSLRVSSLTVKNAMRISRYKPLPNGLLERAIHSSYADLDEFCKTQFDLTPLQRYVCL